MIRAYNELPEKIVCVQDLHWRKQNERQRINSEAYHLERQLKQQLDNTLLVNSDLPQRTDSQIDEIVIFCKKQQMHALMRAIEYGEEGQEADNTFH